MNYNKYIIRVVDSEGYALFNFSMVLPNYTTEEYNIFTAKWATLRKNTKYLRQGGLRTTLGDYLFETMGMQYAIQPTLTQSALTTPSGELVPNNSLANARHYFKQSSVDYTNLLNNIIVEKGTQETSYITLQTYFISASYTERNAITSIVCRKPVNIYRPISANYNYFFESGWSGSGSYDLASNYVTTFNLYFSVENTNFYVLESLQADADESGNINFIGTAGSTLTKSSTLLNILFQNAEPTPIDPTINDPYNKGGNTSETGKQGGEGSFDGTSTAIDIPTIFDTDPDSETSKPSVLSSGFVKVFNPTKGQLSLLNDFMWSDSFDIATFKKLFANPMDVILGLNIIPIKPTTSGTATLKIGNIDTGVVMNKVSQQFIQFDCGVLNVKEFYGAYLDYAPYTTCEIYLPYIGIHELNINEIMSKTLNVKYTIDVISGACTAFIKSGDSVLYTFSGSCATQIPISSNDYRNILQGVIQSATAIGFGVATGGAAGYVMAASGVSSGITNVANGLNPKVNRSGSLSGSNGIIGIQTPYIIVTIPKQALPEKQNTYTGYPSFITKKLSDVVGYTEIEMIHLQNISATDDELNEIETLLKGGVIF